MYDLSSMKHTRIKLITIILLTLMGFTHGGGFVIASSCLSKTQSSCCAMESCCCAPTECQCPGHGQLQLTPSQESLLVQISNPDCSPIKKMISVGFDTSPILLPHQVTLLFLSDIELTSPCKTDSLDSFDRPAIFHPPQNA